MDGADPQLAFDCQLFNSMIMSHNLVVTLEGGQQLTNDGLYRNVVTLARIDARIKP